MLLLLMERRLLVLGGSRTCRIAETPLSELLLEGPQTTGTSKLPRSPPQDTFVEDWKLCLLGITTQDSC
jgi:hypothetical protein